MGKTGLMSVGWGFVVFLLLPASPEKLPRFFNAKEKEIALRRYREAFNIERTKVSPKTILKTFKDPKAWFYSMSCSPYERTCTNRALATIYMATDVSLAAFGNFLPVMIKGFGFSALDTNLMTIPVWVCSGISIVVTCIISDRINKRGIMLLISFSIASIGWTILLASKSQWVEFVGTLFIGSGTLPQVVLCQVWMINNTLGYTKRYPTLLPISILNSRIAFSLETTIPKSLALTFPFIGQPT
jgi:hypothetical protein